MTRRLPGRRVARPGFSLVEALAVMAVFVILVMVGISTLLGAFQVGRAASGLNQRLIWHTELARQFRHDVGEAATVGDGPRPIQEKSTAGLTLKLANGKQVIYRWDGQKLERSESLAGQTTRRRLPLGPNTTAVEFSREGPHDRLVGVVVSESRGPTNLKSQTILKAALGGDLR